MVLASLGHLVLLSLQWGHQDPMNQERFAAFCKTFFAGITDTIARNELCPVSSKNTMENPESFQVHRRRQGFADIETRQ